MVLPVRASSGARRKGESTLDEPQNLHLLELTNQALHLCCELCAGVRATVFGL